MANPIWNGEIIKSDKPDNNAGGIKLGRSQSKFVTAETRAYQAKYADPLVLCFKILFDYSKPYGLFADELYTDSALAYLKRIGQDKRYETLKIWIQEWKNFFNNYDFLILTCDGLDLIQNCKAHEMYGDSDKLTFSIRETSDMRFQSLLSTWKHIWFDTNRYVEVLPVNLRRFDCNILVYSAGYYAMALYDAMSEEQTGNENPETQIYPTLRKLADGYFSEKTMNEFNHQLYILGDCSIDNEESGKPFTANLNNEMSSDYVKNQLTLKFRFGDYWGHYNNIMGGIDLAKELVILAANDRVNNEASASFKSKVKDWTKSAKDGITKDLWQGVKDTGTTKINSMPNKFLGSNTAIGGTLSKIMDPKFAGKMVKNTIDKGVNFVTDKADSLIGNIQNLVQKNFSDKFLAITDDYYKKGKTNAGAKIIENVGKAEDAGNKPYYIPDPKNPVSKGLQVRTDVMNVYKRKGF